MMSDTDFDPSAVHVLIIEDHAVLAQGMSIVLRQLGYEVTIADGAGGVDGVLGIAASCSPHVVLLDLHLEGGIGDSVPLIGPLTQGGAVVVMLTGEDDRAQLGSCLQAGAAGVAAKTQPLDDIIELVERAARGETLIPHWLRS